LAASTAETSTMTTFPLRFLGSLAATTLTLLLFAGVPAATAQPEPEVAVRNAVALDAGRRHTCAVLGVGNLRCWGHNNAGQLGDGTTDPHTNAIQVSNRTNTGPLTGVADVALGGDSSCALLRNGEVRCWGKNDDGQLGNGTRITSYLPVVVQKAGGGRLTGVIALASGDRHVCAVLGNHRILCWGDNVYGQLARPGSVDRLRASTVLRGTTPQLGVSLGAGDYHTCAATPAHEVRCWGTNPQGQLGTGNTTPSPTPVAVVSPTGTGHLTGVTQVTGMEYGTCARLSNGRARCWGANDHGELGDGTVTATRLRPRLVVGVGGAGALTGVQVLGGGNQSGCATVTGRTARCWGENSSGSLGNDGYVTPQPSPTAVVNRLATGPLAGVTDVASGDFHTCAIASGTVLCFGGNAFDQMGNPSAGGARPAFVIAD
jgi:alpha-tubulin suppressor-like RCC1 family protein